MVGIVIVSHSLDLARAVEALAQRMAGAAVPLAVADPAAILQAIEAVYSDDGVVVLLDLGQAFGDAEKALESLPPSRRPRVRLSEGPLVEGCIAAAEHAAGGHALEDVLAQSRGALALKAAHMGVRPAPAEAPADHPPMEARVTLSNRLGLHVRPAARFVEAASRFGSRITVRNATRDGAAVNAKSFGQVLSMGARQGHDIVMAAAGDDALQALAALHGLLAAGLGDTETPSAPPTKQAGGLPASPGIAIGPAVVYHPTIVGIGETRTDDPDTAWSLLEQAVAETEEEIRELRSQAAVQLGEDEAGLFDAHLLCLKDPDLLKNCRDRILRDGASAAASWKASFEQTTAMLDDLDDPYLRDVGQRVLQHLAGSESRPDTGRTPAILVALDLSAAEVARLDVTRVLGICTALGTPNSHAAVLSRALGIPTVVRAGAAVAHLAQGTTVALDGSTGQIWVNPDVAVVTRLQAERDHILSQRQKSRETAQRPAVTRDGRVVPVMANLQGVDVQPLLSAGADGVGLLRTEFLFVGRTSAPSEEHQFITYCAVAGALGGRPLVIRTADVGGDKPLPYVDLGSEANPFLGWRGIRQSLELSDMLKAQLRAILRASHRYPIRVLLPMVASLHEVMAAREVIEEAQKELEARRVPFNRALEVGIMIEIPAAAVMADQMAPHVDFLSVGTNDLSQYVMAADRTNRRVARLADPLEPSVLRLIRQTALAGRGAGKIVSVCGDLASDPVATGLLLGLGIDELSANPPSVPLVKAAVARTDIREAQTLARRVLDLESAQQVRDHLASSERPAQAL